MAKIVTSAGLNEFVSTGKVTEEIKRQPKEKPAAQAPALEVKPDKPIAEVGGTKGEPADVVADDIDDSQVRQEWSPEVLAEITRKNAAINKKHRAWKEAQTQASDAEEFARGQWNEKRLAEERATKLEQELAELKAKAPAVAPKAERVKPDPQKFYDEKGQFKAFEYAEELAAYSAAKAVDDDRKSQADEKRRNDAQAAEALARTRMAEAEKKYPDFREVMAASTVRTHNAVLEYLTASDHIGEVSYYLEKNPDFVEKINQMHPLKAIAEIGKLELTFDKPAPAPVASVAPVKVTQGAPAPITPLNSQVSADTNIDPAKMSYRQLRAYERSREKRR